TPGMARAASRILGNRCSGLIVPTEKVKKELISYGVKKPIFIVPNGLDVKKFNVSNSNYLRTRFNLSISSFFTFSVGRLGIEKSVDFLINSFLLISKSQKDAKLVIVGDGAEKENLIKQVQDLGLSNKVLFTGTILHKDLPKVYKDADLFIFASTTETQGMVILEAMASGLPILAARDEAIGEIIGGQENGMLVEKNEKEFAKQAVILLKNKKLINELSRNAKKRAAHFSVEKSVNSLEKVYKLFVR
ncbi:glycosyltransferase, partial [Patescibacteria group bacterium]|nr:glycosyltransferase [Patescibacteria group bacterium]